MTTFVLLPGGWHGGWWYQPLVDRLHQHGERARPITLTGVGDRSHPCSIPVNLDTHIDDVIRVMDDEQIDNAVLVAHSYSGMVMTAVADRIPHRIQALVYIDAPVPRDGQSLWSITTDRYRTYFIKAATDGYTVDPPPNLDPRATGQPLATFVQPVRLTGAADQINQRYFVYLTGWNGNPLQEQHAQLLQDPGWTVITLPRGHDIMAEAPDDTLRILLRISTGKQAAAK
jgi:pimeloyl-ACP methyl ester carboxylesterase